MVRRRSSSWEQDAVIKVRNLGRGVVIEANAAGLRTLVGHLLTLAKDGVADGSPPGGQQRSD
jgi:bisphosphoglycerate-dependent phosphoglycerate mutase